MANGTNKESSNRSSTLKNRGIRVVGIIIATIITPIVTLFNTIRVESLNREVDLVRYFQKEIKGSFEQLSGENSEQSRVALASLYSLANDYDKKRVLISIALSRDSGDLDEAISYLILSEDKKTREELLTNNPSLREAARKIEAEWVIENYSALESVRSNADIRPQITNASTQLLSLFSNNSLDGWMLLGRFSQEASNDIINNGQKLLDKEKEISKSYKIESEGAIIDKYEIKEFKQSTVKIVSPIYIRQSPPSNSYSLSNIAESSDTSIIGVICENSEVKIIDYKPIRPEEGNHTLWGKVVIENSKTCYYPGLAQDTND